MDTTKDGYRIVITAPPPGVSGTARVYVRVSASDWIPHEFKTYTEAVEAAVKAASMTFADFEMWCADQNPVVQAARRRDAKRKARGMARFARELATCG